MSGLDLLKAAAQKFIDKCDHGRAQSKVTYRELREALAILRKEEGEAPDAEL